ncbi:hypothetical protein ACJX0J_009300 [Zea mays]
MVVIGCIQISTKQPSAMCFSSAYCQDFKAEFENMLIQIGYVAEFEGIKTVYAIYASDTKKRTLIKIHQARSPPLFYFAWKKHTNPIFNPSPFSSPHGFLKN